MTRTRIIHNFAALLIVGAAVLLRQLLNPVIGASGPYLTVFPAVLAVALLMQLEAALVAAAAGVIATEILAHTAGDSVLTLATRAILIFSSAAIVSLIGYRASRTPSPSRTDKPAPAAQSPLLPGKAPRGKTTVVLPQVSRPISADAPQPLASEAPQAAVPQATEEALRNAIAAADSASRARQRFLSKISNELRSPLANATRELETLQRDDALSEATRDSICRVNEQLEHQTKLIDALLDLTRMEKGTLNLFVRPVGMHEVIREAARLCGDELKSRQQRLELQLEAQNAVVNADRGRIGQVVMEILGNAMKFTPEKGTIIVSTRNLRGRLQMAVQDSGVGIEASRLPRIFGAFAENAASGCGLGIGLALCRGLLHLQGGAIAAASEGPGQGATFTIDLPLAESAESEPLLFPAAE